MQIYSGEPSFVQTIDGLVISRISLRLHLQSSHFGGPIQSPHNNGLILRCTAQIGNLYQQIAEIELGVPQRDPIPARGKKNIFFFQLNLMCFLHFFYLLFT